MNNQPGASTKTNLNTWIAFKLDELLYNNNDDVNLKIMYQTRKLF